MQQAVDQYLRYLRLERERPTINYLQRLIQHQLTLVPYETFSKFYYFSLAPDYIPPLPLFVQNLREKGWGGTCFTLNMNFARLLTELGFACSFVRVEPGHLAIMVEIGHKKLYVDVGYGSPIMKPVELEARFQHKMHGFGEEIIISQTGADLYEIDRRSNGKTFVKKRIIWEPLSEQEILEDIRLSYLDQDENITMRRITAVRFNGHQCFYLRNETMKVMTFRNIQEIKLNSLQKWLKVVHDVYQVEEISLRESIDFLGERNIFLFLN
ncbi:arylamine N-acetyltransferase [Lederbergia sp. NSJ-179]|uniref:arylamine N-acetyltransferase n=1 Tax=Lederbergia sp. NSJ-179 TaxID=2931402 RepID=UPI001FD4ACA0|nr:arylamine N-acetyltransferase [Lederbergia sp. NSJ-179]MCJ7840981.1 arylamine N-acetyltransferase [Lederbergia sp. NSJ-179]